MVRSAIRVACLAAVVCFLPEAVTANSPANIAKTAGDNQTANINVQFGSALAVTVTDSTNTAVSSATVTFTVNAAGNGASTTLYAGSSSSTTSITATTNSKGVASVVAVANSTAGIYTVTAGVSGVTATPNFSLTNAQPTVIATNLGTANNLALTLAAHVQGYAEGFTMTSTYVLSSVTLDARIDDLLPLNALVVGLYTDNGGKPETLIQTLNGPRTFRPGTGTNTPFQNYAFTASPPVTLTAGQTYWLEAVFENGAVSVYLASNSSPVAPTGAITFTGSLFDGNADGDFTSTSYIPFFELDGAPTQLGTSQIAVGPQAGTASVVLASSGPWTATANDSWLTVPSGSASGTGNAVVQFSYTANTGSTQTGTITIAGQTLTVTQAGSTYEATSEVTTPVSSGLSAPENIAIDSSGDVYFVDFNHNAIKEWNASTQSVSTVVSTGFIVKGIALDSAGDIYLSDYTDGNFDQWQVSGNQIVTLAPFNGSPAGEATDPSGNVYIGDITNLQIDEWSPSTSTLSTVVTGLNSPEDVAVDEAANIYIMNRGNNTVQEWNSAAQQLSTVFTGPSGSSGVAVDGQGNVYVAAVPIEEWNASTGQIATLVSSATLGESSSPYALRTDALGNLYYTDVAFNTVNKLTFAFVGPTSISEPATAGTDQMLPVLPVGTPLDAVSDSSWLTITGQTAGVVAFSFTANSSATSRTAHITVLGASVPVTQATATVVTATGGTPQGTPTGAAFAAALQVKVTDTSNNPLSGLTVTFTPPSSGASAVLSTPAVTDSNGLTSVTATANGTTGSYQVTASVAGASSPATFYLTNNVGAGLSYSGAITTYTVPATGTYSIVAYGAQGGASTNDGSTEPGGLGAEVGGTFALTAGEVLSIAVGGQGGSGINGIPGGGGGGTFVIAPSNVILVIAGGGGGADEFDAGDGGVTGSAGDAGGGGGAGGTSGGGGTGGSSYSSGGGGGGFSGNGTDGSHAIQYYGTGGESFLNGAAGGTAHGNSVGNGGFGGGGGAGGEGGGGGGGYSGGGGAGGCCNGSGYFGGGGGSYDSGGNQTLVAAENSGNGSVLIVPQPSMTISGGNNQSAAVSTAFGTNLQVTVTDPGGNPIIGATVTFTAPSSGASGTFAGGMNTAVTNASGVATAAAFTANGTAGAYQVTASGPGGTSVSFSLTNGITLAISATHASPIYQGGPGVISLAVTTSGATTHSATVSDTIDSNFTINSAPGCAISGQAVTCTLAAGSTSTTFNVYVTVSTSAPGSISNTAYLTDSGTGDSVTTGSSTDSITVSTQATQVDSDFVQLVLSGSVDGGGTCGPGSTLTATDELQNTSSSSTVTNPYAEIDEITGGNTLLSQSADSASVAPGATVTFTFHILLATCNTFDLFFDVYGTVPPAP